MGLCTESNSEVSFVDNFRNTTVFNYFLRGKKPTNNTITLVMCMQSTKCNFSLLTTPSIDYISLFLFPKKHPWLSVIVAKAFCAFPKPPLVFPLSYCFLTVISLGKLTQVTMTHFPNNNNNNSITDYLVSHEDYMGYRYKG